MNIIEKKLADLHPAEQNVRLHTDRQLTEYMKSLEKFEQIRPMVIDEEGTILAGNGMYEAMKRLGWETAFCQVKTGLSAKDKKKLMLADNRIFSLGVDNMQVFDNILMDLDLDDISIPGFDDDLLLTLRASSREVDEMLGNYGTLSDTDVKRITASEEKTEEAYKREETPAIEEREVVSRRENRFVTCPNCGERIAI